WAPALDMALVPHQPPNTIYTFDPANGQPTSVAVVDTDPWWIPTPEPRDIHPDGTTHWNNEGNFSVDVRLTDVASGQFADFTFCRYAHMYNSYTTQHGWGGVTYFWFLGEAAAILGGNSYTVW